MGRAVALRSLVAVSLVSIFAYLTEGWIGFAFIEPAYASVLGGSLCGVGMLILFRHRTALGGFNILALFAQERWGIRAGYLQLGFDIAILAGAVFLLTGRQLLLSIVGTMILNSVLATNHRADRYHGFS